MYQSSLRAALKVLLKGNCLRAETGSFYSPKAFFGFQLFLL